MGQMFQVDLGNLMIFLIFWIAWQVRIEVIVRGLEKDHSEHKAHTADGTGKVWTELRTIAKSLNRIEGRLGVGDES